MSALCPSPPPASQQEYGQLGKEGSTIDLGCDPGSLHGILVSVSGIQVTSFLNTQLCLHFFSNKNVSFRFLGPHPPSPPGAPLTHSSRYKASSG